MQRTYWVQKFNEIEKQRLLAKRWREVYRLLEGQARHKKEGTILVPVQADIDSSEAYFYYWITGGTGDRADRYFLIDLNKPVEYRYMTFEEYRTVGRQCFRKVPDFDTFLELLDDPEKMRRFIEMN